MASALVNRLIHVHLRASVDDYLTERPDHLWSEPPKVEEAFSTPRSWHMLSDAIRSYGPKIDDDTLRLLAAGTLTPAHASGFCGYAKIVRHRYGLDAVVRGDAGWPAAPADRDLLYFLAESFRARLVKDLPAGKQHASPATRQFAHRAKGLLVELAAISLECAQLVIATGADGTPALPAWFLVEVSRDLPRLVAARS